MRNYKLGRPLNLLWLALGVLAVGLVACGGRGALPPVGASAEGAGAPQAVGVDQAATAGQTAQADAFTAAAPADQVMAATATHTTTAWGTLVSDPEGKPMPGVLVRLAPWSRPCVHDGLAIVCPYYDRYTTKTSETGRFTFKDVPNGEYLLVIGSDRPSDMVHPTIHDHITLRGGVQELVAPTLPVMPCIYKAEVTEGFCTGYYHANRYPVPAVETHGQYRLLTLSKEYEVSMLCGFNALRAAHHLPQLVDDEWLQEDDRNSVLSVAYFDQHQHPIGVKDATWPNLTWQYANLVVGGSVGATCETEPFLRSLMFDRDLLWYGGRAPANPNNDDHLEEFPPDPRSHKLGPAWL